jgi:hypothetical protein
VTTSFRLPVGSSAALAVTVAGVVASLLGQTALLVPVLIAQTLLVVGWYAVLGVPGRDLGALLAIAGGFVGDIAMVVRGGDPSLGPLAGVLGPAVAAAIAVQLLRTDGRERVTASLTATVSAVVLSLLAATLLAERGATHGQTVTVVAVLAAGVATAVLAAPLPAHLAELPAFAAATVLGTLAGLIAGDMNAGEVALLAAVAALMAVAGRRAAGYVAWDLAHPAPVAPVPVPEGRAAGRAARRSAAREARRSGEAILVVGSALPVVLAAPASYVLGRLLVG